MYKRSIAIITLISISTFFLNGVTGARAVSRATTKPSEERNRSCALCSQRGVSAPDSIDELATLGRRTQLRPFTPIQRSMFEGTDVNLVSTSTGHLAFATTDLEISGAMPIAFQRVYASDRTQDRGLGAGWSFAFDDRIALDSDQATLSTGAGPVIAFRRDGQTQRFVLKTDEPTLHQSFTVKNENTIIEIAGEWTRTYKKLGSGYRLSQVVDPTGNRVTISFDKRGNITSLASSGGAALALQWSAGEDARLLAVTDNIKRRVGFRHEGSRLRSVTDPVGGEWTFDYQGGRLSKALDPLNRVLLRARYDKAGRVIEAGDAAGTSRYEYHLASAGALRQTVITDSLGAKTIFEHTEQGALASITDDEGQSLLQIDYNEANRPIRVLNPQTGNTEFSYDSQNRVIRRSSSDGTFETYAYDESGHFASTSTQTRRTAYLRNESGSVISAKSESPSDSYQTVHDSQGRVTLLKSEAGSEVSIEYDAAGNTSAFTVPKSGRFELEYDALGRVTSRRLPSGAVYRYDYDARGTVAKQSDGKGRLVKFERDASGAITGVVTSGGNWIRATRDEAGRINSLNTSAGKSRRFTYNERGALTEYIDARGKRKRLGFDRRGRVQTIDDDDGNKTVIERDKRGRVSSVNTFRGKNGWYLNGRFLALVQNMGAAQFAPTIYNASASRVGSSPQGPNLACMFDGSDDFMDPNSYYFFHGGCTDPFGGFGSSAPYGPTGGGSFDPFFGFGPGAGETCEQCKARQLRICLLEKSACVARIGQGGSFASVGCIAAAVATGGLALILCGGAVFGGMGLGGLACDFDLAACLLRIVDKCPQC